MKNYSFIILVLSLGLFFSSCKKDSQQLYGISIETNKMINTPAEVFSLQQIKIFMASNDFTLKGLVYLAPDSSKKEGHFAFSPLYLTYTLAQDSSFNEYLNLYEKKYDLLLKDQNKRLQIFESFLSLVKDIDSSINIQSKITENTSNKIKIEQSLSIDLAYDEISIEQDKYSSDKQITISDKFPVLESSQETMVDFVVGNGNYVLTLIQPQNGSLKEYISTFSEEKYASLIKQMENRKTSVRMPFLDISMQEKSINDINFSDPDSILRYPKDVVLNCSFSFNSPTSQNTTFEQTLLKSNNSSPLLFNKDFMFILRGKSSNLIMFIGYYSVN